MNKKRIKPVSPMVSVIMPVYNAEQYIEEAVNSILKQSYKNIELILVDDGSSDNSVEVLKRIMDKRCVLHINQVNQGIATSRNIALKMARGKYVAFMDDDDVAEQERIATEVNFLENNEEFGIVGGKIVLIDKNGDAYEHSYMKEIWWNPKLIKAAYLFQSVLYNSTIMMRKEIIDSYQLKFEDNCQGMEDYRFYMECSKITKITNLDQVFLRYRVHEASETQKVRKHRAEKRAQIHKEIQKISLEKSGFNLEKAEMERLLQLMPEGKKRYTVDEINDLHYLLEKIVSQAKEMKCNYVKELVYYCKQRFGNAVASIDSLWSD